jgi:tetratricopeptide (TPR) repeat protein
MRVTPLLMLTILAAAISARSSALPRGEDRLRELVIFPQINVTFNWGMSFHEGHWVIDQNVNLLEAIAAQREELKRRPDDMDGLMHLAYLLDSNEDTNESKSIYQKAEQLCRNNIATNPQDGLSLTELGRVLDETGEKDEAEHCFRKGTLVSSNDWRCWVGLGNFLSYGHFWEMFPSNYWGYISPGKAPSEEVLDYWPPAEKLVKAESACHEASRCFHRAAVLAPKEPEVYFQQAGYMMSSNWQACFFRHYRNFEVITSEKWLLAFLSPETITNLYQAAELEPNDCNYLSLAIFYEISRSRMDSNLSNVKTDSLTDDEKDSIHRAITQLETFAEHSDKIIAAKAFENVGMLNMFMGNRQLAIDNARRAVALDQTRDQSWDLLLFMLMEAPSPDKGEELVVCESKLKAKNSARNHLIYSKVLANMKKWNKATEQAEIADKLEANNVIAPLMLAAIALKQSEETNYLLTARTNLFHSYLLLQQMPQDDTMKHLMHDWSLDTIIFYILNHQLDSAKETVNGFLKIFPDDEAAKDISRMLN